MRITEPKVRIHSPPATRDAGPISWMGSLSTGRLARRRRSAAWPLSTAVSFSAGPMVRIRFPPAESRANRWRLFSGSYGCRPEHDPPIRYRAHRRHETCWYAVREGKAGASSRELQAASTASLADSARLATCGRTLSPPPAMKGSHGSHRPHAAPPWEGRSAGRRSAWDDCGKARRPLADPGPSPGRWR